MKIKIINYCMEELLENFLAKFIDEIKLLKNKSDSINIALPGGRSLTPFLDALVERPELYDSWKDIHFFPLDERCVPIKDKDHNFTQIKNIFFEKLIQKKVIAENQIHSFNYEREREEKCLDEYNKEFESYGHTFQIVFLGVGEDGHVASLFPNHSLLNNKSSSYIQIDNSPKPPSSRITASVNLIQKSEVGFVFFMGDSKKEALMNFLDPKKTIDECPAKMVLELKKYFVFTNIDLSREDI